MADLPPPPTVPARDLGWLGSMLPVAGSVASLGLMSAANGHGLAAAAMIGSTALGTALGVDQHRQRGRRGIENARREYAARLRTLTPSHDWDLPQIGPETDPVGVVLAHRAVARLRSAADRPEQPRVARLDQRHRDLRAEMADGCWLDLREAAAGGVGPHGLIVGATGSGKSELLQALVLSLALRHRVCDLAVLLIDFKGGAALGELAALPHCAGWITNLIEDPRALPRMIRALAHEIDRRQRMVRDGDPPGALVVVIDEVSELLTAHPELLDVLIRIGRVGRSLGIHLILASQRLEESRMRELDAHLSWRLALRTFTEAESRAAIGVPDAATLPREPGWALLRTGSEAPRRLRIAPAPPAFRTAALDLIRTAPGATATRPIWLAPLRNAPSAPSLRAATAPGQLPIGVSDDPVRRRVLSLDPRTGHVGIVGRPGSGKSTLLAALAAELEHAGVTVIPVDRHRRGPPSWLRDQTTASATAPRSGRTVLIVDDWGVLRQERPDLEDALVRAAVADPTIRLVLAAHRWVDVRPGLRDLLSTRIELTLTDAFDSIFDRRTAAALPREPGWGLFEGLPFLAALPADPGDLG